MSFSKQYEHVVLLFSTTMMRLDNSAARGGAMYAYDYNKAAFIDSILSSNLALQSFRTTHVHGLSYHLLIDDCFCRQQWEVQYRIQRIVP